MTNKPHIFRDAERGAWTCVYGPYIGFKRSGPEPKEAWRAYVDLVRAIKHDECSMTAMRPIPHSRPPMQPYLSR